MALTERLQILIDAHGGGAIAEFKKVGTAAQGLQGSVAGGQKSMGGLGQAGLAAGSMMKAGLAAGATAAAAAIVGFGVSSAKAFNDLGQEVLKFQRASGATAEEASALIAAFDDMGIEAETGSKAIFQLGKRLETSGKALAGFGITAVKNKSGNTDLAATLSKVADAYVNTTDPAQRAALVTAAFGKSGQDLIPILEQGSAGIAALYASADATGQILSQEEIDKTEDFRIAMDDLGDAGREFSLMAGKVLVPVITDIANAATAAIGAIEKIADGLGKIGDVKIAGTTLKGIADKVTDVVVPGKLLVGTILDLTRGSGDAADGLGDMGEGAAQLADDTAEANKELDTLTKTLFSAQDALYALEAAEENLSDANTTLAKATADYNKLLKDGAVDEEKVADARHSLSEATRSLGKANRDLAKSQKEYDEALAIFTRLGTDDAADDLADAGDNLADAKDGVASATEREKDARDDLAKAQAGDPEFQTKLAAAKESVSDATTAVANATRDLGRRSYENEAAQKAEAAAIGEHADQVLRLRGELEALLKLHPEMFAFLAPIIESLGKVGTAAPANPTAAAPLGPVVVAPPTEISAQEFADRTKGWGGVPASTTTTTNVTINTAPDADARLIAKEVMWNLN